MPSASAPGRRSSDSHSSSFRRSPPPSFSIIWPVSSSTRNGAPTASIPSSWPASSASLSSSPSSCSPRAVAGPAQPASRPRSSGSPSWSRTTRYFLIRSEAPKLPVASC
ncbi:MAG: hypothetical protein AMS25_03915 [Gemmatimonas sp. SM23_52]|nr:MAG: hypothetical protein AMS25_03915 [Gemmatimonas sp. SM23_52]